MSRYTKTPEDLAIPTERSPRAKWEATRKPLASMREYAYHGHDVMKVPPEQRPRGWRMNNITEGDAIFPGDIPLVPECTGDDGIPDWIIAGIVRRQAKQFTICGAVMEAAKLKAESAKVASDV